MSWVIWEFPDLNEFMRIAIIGSHGTGKTTLGQLLSQRLRFNFIPDVAREAHQKKFTINERTPPETQFWILSKQLELERNTEQPWICEKCLLDNLVYAAFSIKDQEIHRVLEKIIFANANYDLIFYLPIEFPLVADGLRSLDPKFQKAIDREYRRLLKENKIKVVRLKGSVDERFHKALGYIHSHHKFPQKSIRKK